MKKVMFLPVIFILGFVAGVSAKTSHYVNGESALTNVSKLWSDNLIASDSHSIKHDSFGASAFFISPNNVAIVEQTNLLDYSETTAESGLEKSSRINTICKYKPQSLIKD